MTTLRGGIRKPTDREKHACPNAPRRRSAPTMSAACCGLPPEGGARQFRQGRNRRRRAQGGRGSRDRARDQEAGRDRPEARDRRRIPPLVVALRFLPGPRRRRILSHARRHPFRRGRHQGGERARHRQDRLPVEPPACRALQIPQGALQGDAEDDDPGAVDAAFPSGPAVDQPRPLSRPRRLFRRRRHRLPSRPSVPSTTPAAAICNSTTPPGR